MKMLKKLGIVLLLLIILVLILGAFAPKQINVSRTLVINSPQSAVFEAVNDFKTWKNWSPWVQRDSTIKMVISDPSAGNGAYYTWTSKNSGAGQMSIINIFNKDRIQLALEFDKQGTSDVNFMFRPIQKGTETTWSFYVDVPYPFNAMLLFQNPSTMLGKDYEEGLANLKTYVEAISPMYTVTKISFPATRYLAQRATVKMVDMAEHFQTVMPTIATAFLENNVKMAGPASGLFYTWDEESQSSDLAIGIPSAPDAEIDGLVAIDIPLSKAFQVDYYGPYEETSKAHEVIHAFFKRNNLDPSRSIAIEKYITDPSTEPDPSKWLTEVIYVRK